MSKIKEIINQEKSKFIQNYRGQPLYHLIAALYDIGSWLSWHYSKNAQESIKKMKRLKNKYRGKRCFIIGNGPSLKRTNLKLLRYEYTFGLNRIYLLFKKLGFNTSFLVSTNSLVISQSKKEIERLKMPKFISWKSRGFLKKDRRTIYLRTLARQHFSKDCSKGVWEGATVTYVALQLAYYMGFDMVYLIGVDHNFNTKGRPHNEIISQGNDRDHFSPSYFGRGFRWNLPDLATSEYAYRLADKVFRSDGRKVIDATVGGKLKIFKKVDYQSLF
jgi:hypothetical protein